MLMQRAQGYDVLGSAGHHVLYYRYTGRAALTDEDIVRGKQGAKTFEKRAMRMLINFSPGVSTEESVARLTLDNITVTAAIRLRQDDELDYQGRKYRIESDAEPSLITGFWQALGSRIT